MTGWVCYDNSGALAAHSDLLLSARAGEDASLNLPILQQFTPEGTLVPPKWDPDYTPIGMCQKIVLISPRLAYLWAGNLSAAQELDVELRKLHASQQRVIDILPGLATRWKEEELSALILDGSDLPRVGLMSINAESTDFGDFGTIFYAGSGQGEFFGTFGELMANLHPATALEDYEKGTVSKKQSDAAVRPRILDSKLQYRMLYQHFNHVMTGGAVDTLRSTPDRFYKMTDYLYAFFYEELYEELGFSPRLLIKRTYENGYLGYSISDTLTRQAGAWLVPDPSTYNQSYQIGPRRLDPFEGDLWGVACIYVSSDGHVSHHMDDAATFRKHFKLDHLSGRVVVSEWYQSDHLARRERTNNLSMRKR